jgi:hypothetical protein
MIYLFILISFLGAYACSPPPLTNQNRPFYSYDFSSKPPSHIVEKALLVCIQRFCELEEEQDDSFTIDTAGTADYDYFFYHEDLKYLEKFLGQHGKLSNNFFTCLMGVEKLNWAIIGLLTQHMEKTDPCLSRSPIAKEWCKRLEILLANTEKNMPLYWIFTVKIAKLWGAPSRRKKNMLI